MECFNAPSFELQVGGRCSLGDTYSYQITVYTRDNELECAEIVKEINGVRNYTYYRIDKVKELVRALVQLIHQNKVNMYDVQPLIKALVHKYITPSKK